jgi:hypothetical protein
MQIVLLLPMINVALSLLGFRKTSALLERSSVVPAATSTLVVGNGPKPSPHRIARLVDIAARHGVYRATCLRQSLLLFWLLKKNGSDPEFVVGARKGGNSLEAHAWVEIDGAPLNESEDVAGHYAVFNPASATMQATRSSSRKTFRGL